MRTGAVSPIRRPAQWEHTGAVLVIARCIVAKMPRKGNYFLHNGGFLFACPEVFFYTTQERRGERS